MITETWKLSNLGKGPFDTEFTKERKKTLKHFKVFHKKWATNEKYLTNVNILKEALDDYEKLNYEDSKEGLYLFLASSLNSEDTEVQAAQQLLSDYTNTLSDYTRFFVLSLGTISKDMQKEFLKSEELLPYRNYLKDIFSSARYMLSEKEEKILSMKSGVSYGNWVSMLEEFLSSETKEIKVKGKKEETSFAQLMNLMRSSDDKLRNQAVTAVQEILEKHSRVAEKEMNSFLENKKINDQLRGYKRPDESRHVAEGLSGKAVDTLVETVTSNFKISQDYYKLKAKLMGVKSFSYFERVRPYGKDTQEYSYAESVDVVSRSLARISDEFKNIFEGFVKHHQIDVYPKKGKRGGAFCVPLHKLPVHILLNHDGSTRDVTTLAHEVGHGIHGVKARKENSLNYDVPMCTAEVASTFCEDFVIDALKEEADDEQKLYLLMTQLEDKVATIFRQIAAYNFEKELHLAFREKGYLPKDDIGKLFIKHMKSYMGSAVSFDEKAGMGWIYWNHFRTPFYVFAYSMALLVSQYAKKRFEDDPRYISKINEFYETGSSKNPAQIFRSLGINVNNNKQWQEGIDEVNNLLKETKKLAKKLKKI